MHTYVHVPFLTLSKLSNWKSIHSFFYLKKANGEGFEIALHDHRSKPVMQYSSQLIRLGTAVHINVKPSIQYTSDDAIKTFSPKGKSG